MTFLLLAACEPATNRTYPVFIDTSDEDTDTADTAAPTGDTSDTGDDDTGVDPPDPVKVDFEGRIATVTGTPFGFDATVEDSPVSGFFTYDRSVVDGESDAQESAFDHRGGTGPFLIAIEGSSTVFVAGSTNPVVSIDLATDTFEWDDGPQPGDGGYDRFCTVDGLVNEDVEIEISFSPSGATSAFDVDELPAIFPFLALDLATEVDVVFTIEDGADTLLIQLSEISAGTGG